MYANKMQEKLILDSRNKKAEKEKKKTVSKQKTSSVTPQTTAKINQQKQKYDKEQENKNYWGKRVANTDANKVRKKAGLPLYSSAIGDKQASLTNAKTLTGLKQNISNQMASNANKKVANLSANHPLNRERKTVSPIPTKTLQDMFDKNENYIDKFKKGNIKGGVASLLGETIQLPQSALMNLSNNINSVTRGKGLQPYHRMMDYTDFENQIKNRNNVKPFSQLIGEKNKALGNIYSVGMDIATDPLNLLDVGAAQTAKQLKTLGSAKYADSLANGKLVPTAGTPTRKTATTIGGSTEVAKPRSTQFKDKDSYINEIVEELGARHNPRNLTTADLKIRDNGIAKELDNVANMTNSEFKEYARRNKITSGQLPRLHEIKAETKMLQMGTKTTTEPTNVVTRNSTKQLNLEDLRTKLNVPQSKKVPLNIGTPVVNLERGNKGTIAKDMGDGNYLVLFDNKATSKQALIKMSKEQFTPIEQVVNDLEHTRAFNKAKNQIKNSPRAIESVQQGIINKPNQNIKPILPKNNTDTLQGAKMPLNPSKTGRIENHGIEERYKEFMSGFDGEPTGNTGVGEWVNGINSKGVGIGKDITRNADTALKGEARQWFKDTFEDNFYTSKGQYANNVKDKTDLLYKEVVKKRGIKKGSQESAGAQWFGEGQKMVNNEPKPYTLADLQEEFSYKMPNGKYAWQNIVETDGIMRKLYDNYVNEINESLRKIYPNVEQEVAKMQAKKTGKSLEEMAQIDRDINKYVTGKRLTPRKDYYHHFQELQNGFFSQIDNIMNSATNIDPKLVGASEFTRPKSKFMGALQHRSEHAEYKADALGGMLEYIPQAEYKVNIEPNIPVLRNMIKDLKDYTNGNANQLIDYLMKFTNDLAGKTNPLDRAFLNALGDERGRKVLNSLGAVSNRVRANAVVGNANTVLAQFFNMPNVVGYAKNPVDILNGMVTATKATIGHKEAQSILNKSDFLRERYLDRSTRRFDTGVLSDLNKFFSWTMELGDKAVSDSAFITFYNQAVKKGLADTEAIKYADNLTRKSVAGRGIGELPLEQKAKVTKLFAPFQVEVRNAYNVLKELGSKKDAGGILAVFATTWLMNQALEAGTGRRIGFDPIDVLLGAYQDGEGKTTGQNIKDTAFRMGGEALTNMPFGSYVGQGVTSTLDLSDNDKQKLFGESDPTRFGTGNMAVQTLAAPFGQALKGQNIDLLKPAMAVIPPFGGKQLERSIRGLQDMAVIPKENVNLSDGIHFKKQDFPASYSNSGQMRFAIKPTAENYIKAPTLGIWATDEGKNYINGKLKPMSDKQTELVQALAKKNNPVDVDKTLRETYKGFSDYKKSADKDSLSGLEKAYIINSTAQKGLKDDLYGHLNISEETIERLKYLKDNNVSLNTATDAAKLIKDNASTIGKVSKILSAYPDNGEVIAKGLGYSKGSIQNAKLFIKKGIKPAYYEKLKMTADTNGNGKINAKEAHDALKNENLTSEQRTYLIRTIQGEALKEKK